MMETTLMELSGFIVAFLLSLALMAAISRWRLWWMRHNYSMRTSPLTGDNGNLLKIETLYGTLREKDKELSEERQKLSGIVKSITDHMVMIDEQLTIVWANDKAREHFGNDIVGRKCFEVYHQRPGPCTECAVKEVFLDGNRHERITNVNDRNGKKLTFWCTASVAAKHEDGRPRLVVEISREITPQKRTSILNLEELTEAEV